MPEVKICGLTRSEDIAAANAALPDYIGFVFAHSRRMVTPDKAAALRQKLQRCIRPVGVFVDERIDVVAAAAEKCRLFAVQLHGSEGVEYIEKMRVKLQNGCEIWKAARVRTIFDIEAAAASGAQKLILDAYDPNQNGGTGRSFDWGVLSKTKINMPFLLAGGITADNAEYALKEAKRAAWSTFGLDVSSGVETGGYKDKAKMAALVAAVRVFS